MRGDVHSGSPSESLDEIRMGGSKLVLTAHQRLAEIKQALDHGRFGEAFTVCSSLQEKLGHLAAAEGSLGRLCNASIVRVADLEIGMDVLDAGVIAEIGDCENCEREQCDNVTIKFQNGQQVTMDCDQELAVQGSE